MGGFLYFFWGVWLWSTNDKSWFGHDRQGVDVRQDGSTYNKDEGFIPSNPASPGKVDKNLF